MWTALYSVDEHSRTQRFVLTELVPRPVLVMVPVSDLDTTVIHPLQVGTVRTGAATTPGFALTNAYNRKMRD